MAKDFFDGIITDDFKELHYQAVSEVISACARPCTLRYGVTLYTDCENCIYDPMTGRSSNRYQTDGPIPFNTGVCPYCNGVGKLPDEKTETLNICLIWEQKEFIPDFRRIVNSPDGYLMTISEIGTLDEIKEAKEIIADTSIQSYITNTYIRRSEPMVCGFGRSDFVFCLWQRIE